MVAATTAAGALQESDGFTIFLEQAAAPVQPGGCALYFQVTDVDARVADATPSIEAKRRLLFKPLKPLSVA